MPAVGLLCHSVTDAQGIVEYQLFADGFQFGTVEQTPQGGVGFRGHPDQSDINGWGSTAWRTSTWRGRVAARSTARSRVPWRKATVFISPPGQRAFGRRHGRHLELEHGDQLRRIAQNVALNGQTTVALTSALTGDMNLGSIASNYLYDYPLNGGGVGNTGDMKSASYRLRPGLLRSPGPVDAGARTDRHLSDRRQRRRHVDGLGQINQSDPNLSTVSKPTVERELVSTDPTTKMIVACNWDSTQVGYWYDNVGIEQIVRPQNTQATDFAFENESNWTLPDPTNPTVTASALSGRHPSADADRHGESVRSGKAITSVQVVIAGAPCRYCLRER